MESRAKTALILCVACWLPACAVGVDDDDDTRTLFNDVAPTTYRMSSIELLDPHAYVWGFLDVTGSVNGKVADALGQDEDGDGVVELSLLLRLTPWDDAPGASAGAELLVADCGAADPTQCGPAAGAVPVSLTLDNGAEGAGCLGPVTGTTSFDVASVTAPCFTSAPVTIDLLLAGVPIHLDDARISAGYGATPADELSGLVAGFMSEAVADATPLPDNLPIVGGKPLSTILKGSQRDLGPGGVRGWWFYLAFTASPATYTP